MSRPGVLALAALLILAGCTARSGSPEEQAIRQVLASRTAALNECDSSRYLAVISPNYHDRGKNFTELKTIISENFRTTEHLSYEASSTAITINGTTAEASSSYRMKVRKAGKELAITGKENLKLVKEADGWKIIAGI